MKISKEVFEYVKKEIGDAGKNLIWQDGEVYLHGVPVSDEIVPAMH